MKIKIITGGEGAKIPGIDIGLSVILFNLFIEPNQFSGYTGATNDATLGNFSFDTDWVTLSSVSEEKTAKWNNQP